MCTHALVSIALYEFIWIQRKTYRLLTYILGEEAWIYMGNVDVYGKTRGRNQKRKEGEEEEDPWE